MKVTKTIADGNLSQENYYNLTLDTSVSGTNKYRAENLRASQAGKTTVDELYGFHPSPALRGQTALS